MNNRVRHISATANQSKRTFTLRVNGSKYRTNQMSPEEFEEAENHTNSDWENFLKSDNYYLVK